MHAVLLSLGTGEAVGDVYVRTRNVSFTALVITLIHIQIQTPVVTGKRVSGWIRPKTCGLLAKLYITFTLITSYPRGHRLSLFWRRYYRPDHERT